MQNKVWIKQNFIKIHKGDVTKISILKYKHQKVKIEPDKERGQ